MKVNWEFHTFKTGYPVSEKAYNAKYLFPLYVHKFLYLFKLIFYFFPKKGNIPWMGL